MYSAVIAGMQSIVPVICVDSRDYYVHDFYW